MANTYLKGLTVIIVLSAHQFLSIAKPTNSMTATETVAKPTQIWTVQDLLDHLKKLENGQTQTFAFGGDSDPFVTFTIVEDDDVLDDGYKQTQYQDKEK